MDFEHAFVSHVGQWRNENQDSYIEIPHKNVFAVADGMGGLAYGSTASQMACKAFGYQADHDTHNLTSYFDRAHEMVLKLAAKHKLEANQVGTTGVVLMLDPQRSSYTVCWCGDSRLYHFRNAEQTLEQITIDHSYIQELLERGKIKPEDMAEHPQRHIITHAIGIGGPRIKTGTKKKALADGDALILCSDGLSNEVSFEQIRRLCMTHTNAQDLAEQLVHNALDSGGHDNVTVGVVCCSDEN